MKKILLILTLVLSFVIFSGENIKISSSTIKQGGFFYIEYPANKEYTVDFSLSQNLKTFELNDSKYIFVPVHYSNAVGTYPIKLLENGREVFSGNISLLDGNFKKSYIKVAESMEEKRSPENIRRGADRIGEAKKTPADKLWEGKFIYPVANKKISSPFGAMRFVNDKVVGYHSGIDFPVAVGTQLVATNTGKVIFASKLTSTGNTLVIDHGMNLFSSYSHMSSFDVKVGQMVKKGDVVGKSGNTGFTTGPHLHFTFAIGTTFVNPHLILEEIILGEE